MKYILSFVLLLSINKATELSIGSMMPEMGHKMKNINGNDMTLSDAKGNVGTLVIFSCNTCLYACTSCLYALIYLYDSS